MIIKDVHIKAYGQIFVITKNIAKYKSKRIIK